MPDRDIVVIGASAGGLGPLRTITQSLPADFPAAVFVVWHLAPSSPNLLPQLLNHRGPLTVVSARDGEPIRPGRVYVATPDQHLLVARDRVRVTFGPKENRFRPAVDALFRSAAFAHGPSVIGVVLSGALDDGTAGLWAIKDRGGLAIVQDPAEAEFPSMPATAQQYVDIDFMLSADKIAPALVRLCATPAPAPVETAAPSDLEIETRIANNGDALEKVLDLGTFTPYSCPECHGALLLLKGGGIPRFRCHTGHAYSMHSLLAEVTEAIEHELWSTARAVQERVLLLRHLAGHLRQESDPAHAQLLEAEAQKAEARLDFLRLAMSDARPAGEAASSAATDEASPAAKKTARPAKRAAGSGQAPGRAKGNRRKPASK